MAARAIARRCSSAASSSRRPERVSIVYGTFCNGSSRLDAQAIAASATASRLRFRVNVEDGAAFDFDGLRDTAFLLVSTSSWLGMPPANLAGFAQQLLLAAETHPGCLAHLQHAVWGRGDERWLRTYMSVPRHLDALLSRCGSRRFFARGELGEPHAPTSAAS